MKAVIVAAGKGTRLEAVTGGSPKNLLEVGGRPLLHRALDALAGHDIKDVWIVLGHRAQDIQRSLRETGHDVQYLVNPFYATTNNMASLWLAVPHVADEPFLYLHADVAFDDALLESLVKTDEQGVGLLVDPESIDEEAMKVRLEAGRFIESSKQIPLKEAAGEWTGITRFTPDSAASFYGHAGEILLEGDHQAYDTAAFNRMAAHGVPFFIHETHARPWLEIDTPEDLEEARRLFPTQKEPTRSKKGDAA